MCPGLAQNHRGLATVPARGGCGTTKRLSPTANRRTAHTRSNVISIREQRITGLGSVITAYRTMIRHDESSRSWVTPMSYSHAAPSAPQFKHADRYAMRTKLHTRGVMCAPGCASLKCTYAEMYY